MPLCGNCGGRCGCGLLLFVVCGGAKDFSVYLLYLATALSRDVQCWLMSLFCYVNISMYWCVCLAKYIVAGYP